MSDAASAKDPASGWSRALLGLALGALAGNLFVVTGLVALVPIWFFSVAAVVIACGLGVLLGLLGWTRLLLWVCLAELALLGLVAVTPMARLLARLPVRSDPLPAQADVVYVFASSLQADGEPTTTAMARLLHGIELVADHRAPRLVLSELPAPFARYETVARDWMTRLHVDAELLTVGPVTTTHEEGVLVGRLMREHGWRSVIVVSSPLHMRRAAAVLEHEGVAVSASPAVEPRFDLPDLPTPEDRVRAFGNILHDVVGWEVYRLRGQLGPAASR